VVNLSSALALSGSCPQQGTFLSTTGEEIEMKKLIAILVATAFAGSALNAVAQAQKKATPATPAEKATPTTPAQPAKGKSGEAKKGKAKGEKKSKSGSKAKADAKGKTESKS
jgi:hypothetical protein